MAENESTLKVNNALLYKTKILEQDIKTKDRLIGDLKLSIEQIGTLGFQLIMYYKIACSYNYTFWEFNILMVHSNTDYIDHSDIKKMLENIISPQPQETEKDENKPEEEQEEVKQEVVEEPKTEQEEVSQKDDEEKTEKIDESDTEDAVEKNGEEVEVKPGDETTDTSANHPTSDKNATEPLSELSSSEAAIQSMNDKKTISRLSNKIKELEILLEAEKGGSLLQDKNKQIHKLEKAVANLEVQIEKKEQLVKDLEKSLSDLQVKFEGTFIEKSSIESIHEKYVQTNEAKIKELEEELGQVKQALESKEKLHDTYQKKIESLLEEKQELIDKVEVSQKKEEELNDIVEQSKGNVSKKDKIYVKMLKLKDRNIQKMTADMENLAKAEKSRQQTIEYFKKRIQVLEKANKECERCKVYAKKKYYKENLIG